MKELDYQALVRLKACRKALAYEEYRTLRGQIISGDALGAMRGLKKILERVSSDKIASNKGAIYESRNGFTK